ncbi:MAG: efflux RND transporter periplasmic adaptor subunit [Steroidobacterales bacterium]
MTEENLRRKLLIVSIVAAGLAVAVTGLAVMHWRGGNGTGPTGAGPAGGSAGGKGGTAVVLGFAVRKDFPYELEALGTARANEAIEVTAKTSNLISAIRFREGQPVRKGDVLVELDPAQAAADLAQAQAALVESKSQYQRSVELFGTKALSQAQLDQIEATLKSNQAKVSASQSRLSDTIIRAPFDGRVGLRRVSLGSLVNPGAVITTLDDISQIKVDFSVPESHMSAVHPALAVRTETTAYPNRSFDGTVQSVDTRVDPVSRAFNVRAIVPNQDGLLKPGMFLTVRLVESSTDAIVVPEQALLPEEGRQFVYIVNDGKAERREIQIGRRRPGEVEVLSGLTANEQIVSEGADKLRPGALVQAVAGGGTDSAQ